MTTTTKYESTMKETVFIILTIGYFSTETFTEEYRRRVSGITRSVAAYKHVFTLFFAPNSDDTGPVTLNGLDKNKISSSLMQIIWYKL